MIDLKLIEQFRDTVNENGFTFFHYRDKDNKDLWNCICSAMDWITVSAEYFYRLPNSRPNSNSAIDVFAFIASADIILESIEQLHRAICPNEPMIFKGDRSSFPDNIFGQDDRTFFKTLRACFGAHPVNLSDPEDLTQKNKKRFASWPTSNVGKGDFTVFLYSNVPGEESIMLSVSFQQIYSFAEKYYNYLSDLENMIRVQFEMFCETMKGQKFSCEGEPLKRLRVLQIECAKRLNNDYYKNAIEMLILTFEIPVTDPRNNELVSQYREALIPLIDEIQQNLQSMEIIDLEKDEVLDPHPKSMPNGWTYWHEKLVECAFSNGYPLLLENRKIIAELEKYMVFSYKDYKELYVLVQAALFRKQELEQQKSGDQNK